jgi:hypothetical protein
MATSDPCFCGGTTVHALNRSEVVLSTGMEGINLWLPQALKPLLGPLCAPVFTRDLQKSPVLNARVRIYLSETLLITFAPKMQGRRSSFYFQSEVALTEYVVGGFLHLSTFPACSIIQEAHNM